MPERVVGLGIVGGGLMGREAASAAARWVHLADLGVRPAIVAVCDTNPDVLAWYERLEALAATRRRLPGAPRRRARGGRLLRRTAPSTR